MMLNKLWAKRKTQAWSSLPLAILLLGGCVTPTPETLGVYKVSRVIDGDTIVLANEQRVRLIGIDTPERKQCGYKEAAQQLLDFIGTNPVVLRKSAGNDKDRYGRLVRYVEVNHKDVGLEMIKSGRAIARYDSRDGYPHHYREKIYWAADKASPSTNVCK